MPAIFRRLKRIVEAVVLIILFGFTWAIITLPLPMVFRDSAKQVIDGVVPDTFPYLVLIPTEGGELSPAIVLHRELEEFKKTHPGYTFLVPEDQNVRLRDELWSRGGAAADEGSGGRRFWSPMFTMRIDSAGRQSIEVRASFDADHENTGWYEATDRDATPRSHESYNRTAAGLRLFLTGMLINVGFWAVLVTAYRARRKRRQQSAAA